MLLFLNTLYARVSCTIVSQAFTDLCYNRSNGHNYSHMSTYNVTVVQYDDMWTERDFWTQWLPCTTCTTCIIMCVKLCHNRFMTKSMWVLNIALCSFFWQSWQYRDRRKPVVGTMPYPYFEWLHWFFILHSTIGSTVHSSRINIGLPSTTLHQR